MESDNVISMGLQKIPADKALADLEQFRQILKNVSAYGQVTAYDYGAAIKNMADAISSQNRDVDMDSMTNRLRMIMSEIGDRHSAVKSSGFDKRNHRNHDLRLPFGIAVLNNKLIAVKKITSVAGYSYYHDAYPYLKRVNGLAVSTLIDTYNYRDKLAPAPAKLSRGGNAIQKIGKLLFENNLECPDSMEVVFTDGKADKAEMLRLTQTNVGYVSQLTKDHERNSDRMNRGDLNGLCEIMEGNIGYINIPGMYSYRKMTALEDSIRKAFAKLSRTRALIIDIRNNPGGERQILQTFAGYIVQPGQSPWIANIAYLRTDQPVDVEEERTMSARYLYTYRSTHLTDKDREAIDHFTQSLQLQVPVDSSRFSRPFYMVLHTGTISYRQPVYILVNERSFSAASVFASAFKGLPNVRIAGQPTDGSSGNSQTISLANSGIEVTVSAMLSFQKDGKTYDGNGTLPDIFIEEDEKQVLNGCDNQLDRLIALINKH